MKSKFRSLLVAGWLAVMAPVAAAQQWIGFVSPEGDFRIAMPVAASRVQGRDGSVEYRAEQGTLRYSVFRRPVVGPSGNIADDIRARITVGDSTVRRVAETDGTLSSDEYMFKGGNSAAASMHKVVREGGFEYELVVQASEDEPGLHPPGIRDYFATFQSARGAVFALTSLLPVLESCASRGNVFSRTLCQYAACLSPAQQGNPVCDGLPRLWR